MRKAIVILSAFFFLVIFFSCSPFLSDPLPQDNPTPLAEAVDDPFWVEYLPGTWACYTDGEDYKYSRTELIFTEESNVLEENYSHNDYFTIIAPEYSFYDWDIEIEESIIYRVIGGTRTKHSRLEPLTDESMILYSIYESGSTYIETAHTFWKAEFIETTAAAACDEDINTSFLCRKWKNETAYSTTEWDFSSGMNWFMEKTTYSSGSSYTYKRHFKITDGVLYFRTWDSDWDPSYIEYGIAVGSDSLDISLPGGAGVYKSFVLDI